MQNVDCGMQNPRRSGRSWRNSKSLRTFQPRCRQINPSCSSPPCPAGYSAHAVFFARQRSRAKRHSARATPQPQGREPATRATPRRGRQCNLCRAWRKSGRVQNPMVGSIQPNLFFGARSECDLCGLCFRDMERACRHRRLQKAVGVCGDYQSKIFSW